MSENSPEQEQEPTGPEQQDPTPLDEQPGEHDQVDPDEGDHQPGEPRKDFLRNETTERNEQGYIGTLPDEGDRPDLSVRGVVGSTNTDAKNDEG